MGLLVECESLTKVIEELKFQFGDWQGNREVDQGRSVVEVAQDVDGTRSRIRARAGVR